MLSDVLRDASEKIRACVVGDRYAEMETRIQKLLEEMRSMRLYLDGPPPFKEPE